MALRTLKVLGPPRKLPMNIESGVHGAKRLMHIGVHNSVNRNAGDTLLFPVVRRAFDVVLGPFNWELQQAWTEFTPDTASQINAKSDGIVLGGGGLLLCDQDGSDISNSGWQWNSTVSAVENIDVPFVIFAIGYNRFRGQQDFDILFSKHISAVVAKADFFGLRNTGSIRALSTYISQDMKAKLKRQVCPTTLLWQLFTTYQSLARKHDKKDSRIFVFNAAFDRYELRFGREAKNVIKNISSAVREVQKEGWQIIVAAHKKMDRDIEPFLDESGVIYDTMDLTDATPEEIITFYAEVDFVFGMRGHSQMIPFGLRRPIMSLISHDKMRFFLEDIGRPEWGVECNAPNLTERLINAITRLRTDREAVREEIARAQAKLWTETCANLLMIGKSILKVEPNSDFLSLFTIDRKN